MKLSKKMTLMALAAQLFLGGLAFSKTNATGICTTSAQEAAFIVIDIKSEGRKTKATITTSNFDGSDVSSFEVAGVKPEVDVTFAKTAAGEEIFIFSYIDSEDAFRQYVCAES